MAPVFALSVAHVGENHFKEYANNGRPRMLVTQNDDHLCANCASELSEDYEIVQVAHMSDPAHRFCDVCREKALARTTRTLAGARRSA